MNSTQPITKYIWANFGEGGDLKPLKQLTTHLKRICTKKEVFDRLMAMAKTAFLCPCQLLLARLAFVKTTPLSRYQRKILVFLGDFSFHEF